jgi:hypothetical protein
MTQQDTSPNNVTISMPGSRSVPIVSQIEIDPMKMALSLMLALATMTAFTETPQPQGPGGSWPHRYIGRAYCTPSSGAADAIAKPSNGKWPWGGRRAAAIVCAAAMKADRFDGRF